MIIIDDSIYGKVEFTSSVERVIQSEPVQRLKNIRQNGAMFFADPAIQTSRFEHSLGVCHLIKILGGSEKEQIAGLLHDISHTAFSHIIDYVLEDIGENFHEKHKLRFLLNSDLSLILRSLGLDPKEFLEDNEFNLLEAEHPALCADRIDYTLRDLLAWEKISQLEAKQFIDSLKVIDGKIVIKSICWGQWFKDNYEYLNERVFRDPKNTTANFEFSKLLKLALTMSVIQIGELFNDDNFVINKINNNTLLRRNLKQIKIKLKTKNSISYSLKFKDRIIDPFIVENGRVALLSKCIEAGKN